MKIILVDYKNEGCIDYEKCGIIAPFDNQIVVEVGGKSIKLAEFNDSEQAKRVYKQFISDLSKIKKNEYLLYVYRFSKFYHNGKVYENKTKSSKSSEKGSK